MNIQWLVLSYHTVRKLHPDNAIALQKIDWPLRRSESQWAGGKLEFFISNIDFSSGHGQALARVESKTVWSKNQKWRGTNTHVYLHVYPRVLMFYPTLLVDGVVVIDAVPSTYKGKPAIGVEYLVQGRGFSVNVKGGYVVDGKLIK